MLSWVWVNRRIFLLIEVWLKEHARSNRLLTFCSIQPPDHGMLVLTNKQVLLARWDAVGTVHVFRQEFTLEDAMELHAFAPLEALPCM
jgi:hypothetical protein